MLFVTHFDRGYLAQFLALRSSFLKTQPSNYRLLAFCLDEYSFIYCSNLTSDRFSVAPFPPNPSLYSLSAFSPRTYAEYVWSLTPLTIIHASHLHQHEDVITYVDADMFFVSDLSSVANSFLSSPCDILFTDHNYDITIPSLSPYGRFCVQYLSVKTLTGLDLVHRWFELCLDWCYARSSPGLFGDQKYLEYLYSLDPSRVFTTEGSSAFQAPWNVNSFSPNLAAVFHFHSFKLYPFHVYLSHYRLPDQTLNHFYHPYIKALASSYCPSDFPFRSWLRSTIVLIAFSSGVVTLVRLFLPSFMISYRVAPLRTIYLNLRSLFDSSY